MSRSAPTAVAGARRRLLLVLRLLDRPRVFAVGALLSAAAWYAVAMVPLVPIRPYCEPFLHDDRFPRTDLGEGRLPGDRLSNAAVRVFAGRAFGWREGPVRIVEVEGGRAILITWQAAVRFDRSRDIPKARSSIDGLAALRLIPPSLRAAGLDPRLYGVWRWPEYPVLEQSNCQVMASLMLRGERFPGDWKTPEELRRAAAIRSLGVRAALYTRPAPELSDWTYRGRPAVERRPDGRAPGAPRDGAPAGIARGAPR